MSIVFRSAAKPSSQILISSMRAIWLDGGGTVIPLADPVSQRLEGPTCMLYIRLDIVVSQKGTVASRYQCHIPRAHDELPDLLKTMILFEIHLVNDFFRLDGLLTAVYPVPGIVIFWIILRVKCFSQPIEAMKCVKHVDAAIMHR